MTTDGTGSTARGHFHSVQFYQDSKTLCGIVGSFLAEGLEKSEPAVMIATGDHTKEIEAWLAARGLDVAALKRDGELTVLDAKETLSLFMADGLPNATAFRYSIGGVIRQTGDKRPGCAVRAYGEMVDLLWKEGLEAAAIRLETLWNELANTQDFKLLCGYSMGNFYKGAALDDIKAQHSHLTSDAGEHAALQ